MAFYKYLFHSELIYDFVQLDALRPKGMECDFIMRTINKQLDFVRNLKLFRKCGSIPVNNQIYFPFRAHEVDESSDIAMFNVHISEAHFNHPCDYL